MAHKKHSLSRLAKVESALVPDPVTTPTLVLVQWVLAHLDLPLDWHEYVCKMDDFTLDTLVKELFLQDKASPLPNFTAMSNTEIEEWLEQQIPK